GRGRMWHARVQGLAALGAMHRHERVEDPGALAVELEARLQAIEPLAEIGRSCAEVDSEQLGRLEAAALVVHARRQLRERRPRERGRLLAGRGETELPRERLRSPRPLPWIP